MGDGKGKCWAECPECGARGPISRTWVEALVRWSTRAPAAPTQSQLERVDAVLMAFTGATLSRDDVWRLKHRVRKALEGEG